jgi:hypothetical protein
MRKIFAIALACAFVAPANATIPLPNNPNSPEGYAMMSAILIGYQMNCADLPNRSLLVLAKTAGLFDTATGLTAANIVINDIQRFGTQQFCMFGQQVVDGLEHAK